MTNNSTEDDFGIVFDADSGICEEEQREILAKINGIAESNRRSLAASAGEGGKKQSFKAKNSGNRFPFAVNIAAAVILAGGLTALFFFHGKTDAQVRMGTRVYNSAGHALFDEIMSAAAADMALGEMNRLSREQAHAAAVENQMSAMFANLNVQIRDNRLEEAAGTIRAMREFLNTPAFAALRSIQARKDLYTQAINSFETMIDEARRNQAAAAGLYDPNTEKALTDLQEENTRLQQRLEESAREKDNRIASLETNLATQTQNSESSRQTVVSLQAENAALNQTITTRENTIETIQEVVQGRSIQDMTIGELSERLARIQQALGQ